MARHKVFEREGTTLFTRAPISFTTAALGGEISHSGPRRQAKHDITIPAGIQSGKQLRQRGAGMPVLNGRGHGDLVVQDRCRNADEADRAAEGIALPSSARPRRATNVLQVRAFSAASRICGTI
jgi:DnaJ-class molecular chaperone